MRPPGQMEPKQFTICCFATFSLPSHHVTPLTTAFARRPGNPHTPWSQQSHVIVFQVHEYTVRQKRGSPPRGEFRFVRRATREHARANASRIRSACEHGPGCTRTAWRNAGERTFVRRLKINSVSRIYVSGVRGYRDWRDACRAGMHRRAWGKETTQEGERAHRVDKHILSPF